MRYLFFLFVSSIGLFAEPIEEISGFNYGILPTNVDLNLIGTDYTLSMAFLGIFCAVMFWIGWNSNT